MAADFTEGGFNMVSAVLEQRLEIECLELRERLRERVADLRAAYACAEIKNPRILEIADELERLASEGAPL